MRIRLQLLRVPAVGGIQTRLVVIADLGDLNCREQQFHVAADALDTADAQHVFLYYHGADSHYPYF